MFPYKGNMFFGQIAFFDIMGKITANQHRYIFACLSLTRKVRPHPGISGPLLKYELCFIRQANFIQLVELKFIRACDRVFFILG